MTSMEKIFGDYAIRAKALANSHNPFGRGIAWVEGQYVPLQEAKIPLLDQGFIRSDLTYDVPAVWDGRFFRLDDHLDRIEASCAKSRLKLPLPRAEVKKILLLMVAKSEIRDAYVELIVTRGLRQVRGATPEEWSINTLYLFVQPYVWVMAPEVQRVGGSAVVARTVRRTPPGSMDPTVKNLQWGDFTRGLFEAHDRGAMYPLLTDGDAHLTEGSGYNIVVIKDGVLHSPARGVLEGITRKTVADAARILKIEMKLDFVPVELAYRADEIFLCTTAGGIMPITLLDGQRVGDGGLGPITKQIWDTYWALHWDSNFSFAVEYGSLSPKL